MSINRSLAIGLFTATALASACAQADDGFDLATAKQCFSCHAMKQDTLSPSFQSIARKYSGVRNADTILVATILHGSTVRDNTGASNGSRRMPPPSAQAPISADEANQLAAWVLNQK